ncbi:predicted protein [Naegleria gruberi]|uniref:Predicted protein n=1 Tax=Naegleria gruberi TaxID=5762 RepID=D2VUH7_NAEGR|nr:uncharacterized protein NAEGRDRAFT_72667 [Naegleria gruberi]EFC39452.1 predicted protein [Naegleria gruberi]|eukprot:XP_002672196.1 predicted protein [Naegleria gruberi strain NEG-M]
MESLSNSPTVSNITLMTVKIGMMADPRLKKWYSQVNGTDADRKVHVAVMESESFLSESSDLSYLYNEMSKIRDLDVIDQFKFTFNRFMIPYERLLIQSLEIAEVLNGKVINIVPLEERLQKLAKTPQKGVKRFMRIRNDPSETLFDQAVVDFALISMQAIVAGGNIPCTKIYAAYFRQFMFHYPAISVASMDYFTTYPKRLIMPFKALKDLFFITEYMAGLGSYFEMEELGKSDYSCALIQTTSFGFEYASSNVQQFGAFLVGPFINDNHIANEIDHLKQLAGTSNEVSNKWTETSGYEGFFEWVDEQQDIMLMILGSTMVLDDNIMAKLIKGLQIALQENPNISIITAFGHINMDLFEKLAQTNAPLVQSVLNNKRFKLLKGFVPQKALMSIEKVKIFFTHCGANSVNEALYFGKLLIGFPYAFDQWKVAHTIEEFQLGRAIYKSREESMVWKSESISQAIHELLYNEEKRELYKTKARHTKSLMRRSGGVKRAAEIVEMVSEVDGDLSWKIADKHLTWWQYYCLDIVLVYSFLMYLVVKLACLLCCNRRKVKKE